MKKALFVLVGIILAGVAQTAAHADTVTLYSTHDAELTGLSTGTYKDYINTHNWGDLGYVAGNVNRTGGPTSTEFPNFGESRGLFEFDLSSIPDGATINSATVSLYVGFNGFSTAPRISSVSLYRVTSEWTEMGVTYNTRPAWNTTSVTSMTVPAGAGPNGGGYNGYINGGGSNIATLVQGWLDGSIPNCGLVTSDTYTQTGNGLLRLYAHEAAGTNCDPRLVVNYTPGSFGDDPSDTAPEPLTLFGLTIGVGSLGTYLRRRRSAALAA